MSISDEDLSTMRARCDAATPGPWAMVKDRATICSGHYEVGRGLMDRDRLFLTHARTDLPRLLEEVERLRAENTLLLDQLKHAISAYDRAVKP